MLGKGRRWRRERILSLCKPMGLWADRDTHHWLIIDDETGQIIHKSPIASDAITYLIQRQVQVNIAARQKRAREKLAAWVEKQKRLGKYRPYVPPTEEEKREMNAFVGAAYHKLKDARCHCSGFAARL